MIKPGTNLCRNCGRTSNISFYRSGKHSQGAELVWDPELNALQLVSHTSSTASFLLEDPEGCRTGDFPPHQLSVLVDGEAEPSTLTRSCPRCKEVVPFPWSMGKLPCFVIALIGARSAGKSAWLAALTNALDALNAQDYPCRVDPAELLANTQVSESTPAGQAGNTNCFIVTRKDTGEQIAMLYLLDNAGELFESHLNLNTPLGRILLGRAGEGYPGLDGAIFVEPAVSDPLNRERADSEKVLKMLSDPTFCEILRHIPVAHVCTFADKLIEQETAQSDHSPLLTEKTFPRTAYSKESKKALLRYYEPDAIVRRIHLQDYIAKQLLDECEIGTNLSRRLADPDLLYHFLVQSCAHLPGSKLNDYRLQFNVADPLIWLLYRLGLFPLNLTGGYPH